MSYGKFLRFFPLTRHLFQQWPPSEMIAKMSMSSGIPHQAIENIRKVGEQMKQQRLVGTAGGSIVKVTVDGLGETLSIEIDWDHQIVQNQPSVVNDLVRTATNKAMDQVRTVVLYNYAVSFSK